MLNDTKFGEDVADGDVRDVTRGDPPGHFADFDVLEFPSLEACTL